MRQKASKRMKVACLTFCAFYALYAFCAFYAFYAFCSFWAFCAYLLVKKNQEV